MKSKKMITMVLAALSIAGGAMGAQAQTVEELSQEMDNRTNTLITAINNVATNLEGVQTNIETNLGNVAEMAQDGLDKANQKIDTNAGNITQNQQDIAENKQAIADEASQREAADQAIQTEMDNRISHVETDANKGIAKATALAALHPLDYDPDNKFDVAAAGGFYKGEKAFALGAFYRPNRNVMLSLASTVSGGDNAYNVGATFKIGKAGKRSEAGVSTAELYAIIGAMQEKMDQQQKRIEELEANQAK